MLFVVFCFKPNTAYEMRISDWSSDVCSSDLLRDAGRWHGVQPGTVEARDRATAGTADCRNGARWWRVVGDGAAARAVNQLVLTHVFRFVCKPPSIPRARSANVISTHVSRCFHVQSEQFR